MISEAEVGGVLMAPIVVYALVAMAMFSVLRMVLGRIGFLAWLWHPALFEVSLFVSILSVLVLFF